MTRPRKPFGASHPGRLPATMAKVLAAEMSDPARLRRGKQYARDGSVLDIVIDPGTVTCEIQGSRSTPYIATVTVRPGDGMPLRRDISFTCTCPDDDNWDGHACKHVVATLFTLSDELLLEPDLLDVWRNRQPHADRGDAQPEQPEPEPRHADHRADRRVDPRPDPLAALLVIPEGALLPDIVGIERIEPQLPRSRPLATVLGDALAHLRIDWD